MNNNRSADDKTEVDLVRLQLREELGSRCEKDRGTTQEVTAETLAPLPPTWHLIPRTRHLALLSVFYLAYDTHLAISFMVGLLPYISNPTR